MLDAGDHCQAWTDECEGQLRCIGPPDPGVCGPAKEAGASCLDDHECRDWQCVEGTCLQEEQRVGAGEKCSEVRACQRGLFCLTPHGSEDEDADGTCTASADPGDACPVGGYDFQWFWQGCAGSLCKAEPDAETGVCATTAPGDGCVEARIGRRGTSSCSDDQWCEDGKCVESDNSPRCRRP